MATSFFTPTKVFTSAIGLRVVLLFYGLYQDANAPIKYTDIDYFVFTDAARYVSQGRSPYDRETYRYTPLLAWLLIPTTWSPASVWFSFGKAIFSIADIVAGWLIVLVLRSPKGNNMSRERALKFACIWLLNPMVATISTRGSSEGLLGVMVVALLWAVIHRRMKLAGVLLGLAVHFKIYPFIYASSLIWYLDDERTSPPHARKENGTSTPNSQPRHRPHVPPPPPPQKYLSSKILNFINPARLTLTITSLLTFTLLNLTMYTLYSTPFLQQTYLHHVTRIDHRHNFSPYNTLLYLSSSSSSSKLQNSNSKTSSIPPFESLAFIPQIALSAVLIPLVLAKKDLPTTMLAQTFAFVAWNKVCTSQVCTRNAPHSLSPNPSKDSLLTN